jgi:Fe2+ or Zn2+ uptake regulation protein
MGLTCPLLDTRRGHCDWCGKKLKGKQRRWCSRNCEGHHKANHQFTRGKQALKKAAAWYYCERCGKLTQQVDVDHIKPANGTHRSWSCLHHHDNLRILCKDCHKPITARQARARTKEAK